MLNLPTPQNGFDAFLTGLASSQNMFNSLAQNKLREAEAAKAEKMAQLPFGGANVPGPAGQIVGLEMIKGLYGENSPQYNNAIKAFNLGQASTTSRIGYQDRLANTLPIRYTTNEGRQIIEQSNLAQGYSPAGTRQGEVIAPGQAPYHDPSRPNYQTPGQVNAATNDFTPIPDAGTGVTPDQVSQQQNQQPQDVPEPTGNVPTPEQHYGLRQIKQDLPASVMQRNLYANNIEKTLNSINLDALTHYNNPLGQLKLKSEQAADMAGLPTSKEYQEFKDSSAKFDFLPNQIRQFYGDSIQPSALEAKLQKLNPVSGYKSAKTAKTVFNSQKDLLKKELQTYRDASRDASVYQGGSPSQTQTNPRMNSQSQEGQRPPPDTVWMRTANGKQVPVHLAKIPEAKARGLVEVE